MASRRPRCGRSTAAAGLRLYCFSHSPYTYKLLLLFKLLRNWAARKLLLFENLLPDFEIVPHGSIVFEFSAPFSVSRLFRAQREIDGVGGDARNAGKRARAHPRRGCQATGRLCGAFPAARNASKPTRAHPHYY